MSFELIQDLSRFTVPPGFRGRSLPYVQLWFLVQCTLFRLSPKILNGWRVWLLRMFGAEIGNGVVIRPSVQVTYPWRLKVGKNVWIGDDVVLFSYGLITIGDNSVISQRSFICTGEHDHLQVDFPLVVKPVTIEDQVWLATDVFVAPGCHIARGVVVGARSSVFRSLPEPAQICIGTPARPIKKREITQVNVPGDRKG